MGEAEIITVKSAKILEDKSTSHGYLCCTTLKVQKQGGGGGRERKTQHGQNLIGWLFAMTNFKNCTN